MLENGFVSATDWTCKAECSGFERADTQASSCEPVLCHCARVSVMGKGGGYRGRGVASHLHLRGLGMLEVLEVQNGEFQSPHISLFVIQGLEPSYASEGGDILWVLEPQISESPHTPGFGWGLDGDFCITNVVPLC